MMLKSVIIRLFRALLEVGRWCSFLYMDYLFVSVSSPLNKQYKYEKKKVKRQGGKRVGNLNFRPLKISFKHLKYS